MNKSITIGRHAVGPNHPCYIVAEMSANHGGDINKAKEIISSAKEAGANAVKLQTYLPNTITLNSDRKDFKLPESSPWSKYETFFSLYKNSHTPWEWHHELFAEAQRIEIDIFSSPFDLTAVDLLEKIRCPAYKIASAEITDIPLLEKVASTGKPVIVSTGLATLSDLNLAVETLRNSGCNCLVLLKCTAAYPAPPSEMNLRTIPNMQETFDCVVGLSDHTLGIGIPVAAVTIGANMIEKHFMLEHDTKQVDSFFSLDSFQFSQMVKEIRNIEEALGHVTYDLSPSSKDNLVARRSLYLSADVKKGEIFSSSNIQSVRPSYGLHPKYFHRIIGRTAKSNLKMGDRLTWDDINLSTEN